MSETGLNLGFAEMQEQEQEPTNGVLRRIDGSRRRLGLTTYIRVVHESEERVEHFWSNGDLQGID